VGHVEYRFNIGADDKGRGAWGSACLYLYLYACAVVCVCAVCVCGMQLPTGPRREGARDVVHCAFRMCVNIYFDGTGTRTRAYYDTVTRGERWRGRARARGRGTRDAYRYRQSAERRGSHARGATL